MSMMLQMTHASQALSALLLLQLTLKKLLLMIRKLKTEGLRLPHRRKSRIAEAGVCSTCASRMSLELKAAAKSCC